MSQEGIQKGNEEKKCGRRREGRKKCETDGNTRGKMRRKGEADYVKGNRKCKTKYGKGCSSKKISDIGRE